MTGYTWTKQKSQAVELLAEGYTIEEAAARIGRSERQLYRWKADIEFLEELDRLSRMIGAANKAERLRIANRMVREAMRKQAPTTKDLLEWLKYAQSETDGIKLELTSLIEAAASVAGGGQSGIDESGGDQEPGGDE